MGDVRAKFCIFGWTFSDKVKSMGGGNCHWMYCVGLLRTASKVTGQLSVKFCCLTGPPYHLSCRLHCSVCHAVVRRANTSWWWSSDLLWDRRLDRTAQWLASCVRTKRPAMRIRRMLVAALIRDSAFSQIALVLVNVNDVYANEASC